jgi:hypothetical protein
MTILLDDRKIPSSLLKNNNDDVYSSLGLKSSEEALIRCHDDTQNFCRVMHCRGVVG